jgi:DNA-binding MarR family transcriptional regulator
MVVQKDQSEQIELNDLDAAYLGGFLNLRMNELVMQAAEKAGFSDVRESHGYVLQHFIDSDRGITELARRMKVSQQAASKAVSELIGIGLLEKAPSSDRRSRRVRLSDRGWQFVRITRQTRKRLVKKLLRKVDLESYEQTRNTLILCLQELGNVERILARRVRAPR